MPGCCNEGKQLAGHQTLLHSLYEGLGEKHTALLQTQVLLGGERKGDTLGIEKNTGRISLLGFSGP